MVWRGANALLVVRGQHKFKAQRVVEFICKLYCFQDSEEWISPDATVLKIFLNHDTLRFSSFSRIRR